MARRKKEPTLEERTRVKIMRYLPDAIECALSSYRRFYAQEIFENAKDFAAHHAACKAAIAHVELLLKLAAWAGVESGQGRDDGLGALLADAQAELQRHRDGA